MKFLQLEVRNSFRYTVSQWNFNGYLGRSRKIMTLSLQDPRSGRLCCKILRKILRCKSQKSWKIMQPSDYVLGRNGTDHQASWARIQWRHSQRTAELPFCVPFFPHPPHCTGPQCTLPPQGWGALWTRMSWQPSIPRTRPCLSGSAPGDEGKAGSSSRMK